MKLALLNGQRQEAQPRLSGECQACGRPMIARCGEERVWHWAHKGRLLCDRWWENETEWHRAWKGQFPLDWQEVVHRDGSGERHIADVKTADGWVIEFQHSHIKPDERRSRETFYSPKLTWVVDGTRRQRDRVQLIRAWNEGAPRGKLMRKVFADDCRLLREWSGSDAPIFFDFGEVDTLVWLLTAKSRYGSAYIGQFSRAKFVENHSIMGQFEKSVNYIVKLVADYESSRAEPLSFAPLQPRRVKRHFRL
jgi:competence protein CoiA